MLEGVCPRCGLREIGWALHFQRYQACPKCGVGLDIYENGKLIARGYSPFEAPEYILRPPSIAASSEEEETT